MGKKYNPVAQAIFDLCRERKISIPDLAKNVGMTFSGLYQALSNDTLKTSTLIEISKILGVTPDYFFPETHKTLVYLDISRWIPVVFAILLDLNKFKEIGGKYESNLNKINQILYSPEFQYKLKKIVEDNPDYYPDFVRNELERLIKDFIKNNKLPVMI